MALGVKRIETRSWGTKYRGPLAIHAAQRLPVNWSPFSAEPFRSALEPITGLNEYGAPDLNALLRGCVVAVVQLVDVVAIVGDEPIATKRCVGLDEDGLVRVWEPLTLEQNYTPPILGHWADETTEIEQAFGDYTAGRFAWILDDVTPLEVPIAAKGSLSLWEWDGAEVPA